MRPVLFALGPFKLYGYGAMIVLGSVLAFGFLHRRMAKAGLRNDDDFWIFVRFEREYDSDACDGRYGVWL